MAGLLCCWHLEAFIVGLEGAAEVSDRSLGGACSAGFEFLGFIDSQTLWRCTLSCLPDSA